MKSILSTRNLRKPDTDEINRHGYIVTDNRLLEGEKLVPMARPRHAMRVQVEEIEDEYWELEAAMPKAKVGIIEDTEEWNEASPSPTDSPDADSTPDPSSLKEVHVIEQVSLPPPPLQDPEPIHLKP